MSLKRIASILLAILICMSSMLTTGYAGSFKLTVNLKKENSGSSYGGNGAQGGGANTTGTGGLGFGFNTPDQGYRIYLAAGDGSKGTLRMVSPVYDIVNTVAPDEGALYWGTTVGDKEVAKQKLYELQKNKYVDRIVFEAGKTINFKEFKPSESGVYTLFYTNVDDMFAQTESYRIRVVAGSAAQTTDKSAQKTASTVLVDGKQVAFDAFNIDGSNYFKLRDLAKVVSGTQKQFDVSWDDANKAINLVSGTAYTVVGGELATGAGATMKATANTSTILKDKVAVKLAAYNINGNNYFKLRDIGQAFDFAVTWDAATNSINIDTSKAYTP